MTVSTTTSADNFTGTASVSGPGSSGVGKDNVEEIGFAIKVDMRRQQQQRNVFSLQAEHKILHS